MLLRFAGDIPWW